jgi:hypothetical protein
MSFLCVKIIILLYNMYNMVIVFLHSKIMHTSCILWLVPSPDVFVTHQCNICMYKVQPLFYFLCVWKRSANHSVGRITDLSHYVVLSVSLVVSCTTMMDKEVLGKGFSSMVLFWLLLAWRIHITGMVCHLPVPPFFNYVACHAFVLSISRTLYGCTCAHWYLCF